MAREYTDDMAKDDAEHALETILSRRNWSVDVRAALAADMQRIVARERMRRVNR